MSGHIDAVEAIGAEALARETWRAGILRIAAIEQTFETFQTFQRCTLAMGQGAIATRGRHCAQGQAQIA